MFFFLLNLVFPAFLQYQIWPLVKPGVFGFVSCPALDDYTAKAPFIASYLEQNGRLTSLQNTLRIVKIFIIERLLTEQELKVRSVELNRIVLILAVKLRYITSH